MVSTLDHEPSGIITDTYERDLLTKVFVGRQFYWRSLTTSLLAHTGLALIAIALPVAVVSKVAPARRTSSALILAPRPPDITQRSVTKHIPLPIQDPIVVSPPRYLPPPSTPPKSPNPEIRSESLPVVRPQTQPAAPKIQLPVVAPPIEVKTGGFVTALTAKVELENRSRVVESSAGFGDPNAAKPEPPREAKLQAPALGSFDNCCATQSADRKANDVVVAVAFSDAARSQSTNGARGVVRQGVFGTNPEVIPKQTAKRVTEPQQIPVEVQFKPKPAYSEQARAMKIEGEVLLNVIFTASGEVRVVNVAKSLGYGLDEAAIRSAAQIVFKPAQIEGRPVDSAAILHIVFKLID